MDQASLLADVRRLLAEKDVLWAELTTAQELNNDLNAELHTLRQKYAYLHARAEELEELAAGALTHVDEYIRTRFRLDERLAACRPGAKEPS